MGRETKILLGILGLLAGAFVGVLSMKLLVPRPPSGAGPDIQADVAAAPAHDLVSPPELAVESLPAAGLQAADAAPQSSRFSRPPLPAGEPAAAEPISDPFVAPASFDLGAPPAAAEEPPAAAATTTVMPPQAHTAGPRPLDDPAPTAAADYVARPGDSWWTLAERVYGDGRFYRALFAWNRALDPRVSLVPGTALQLPPADSLKTAWPALVPRE